LNLTPKALPAPAAGSSANNIARSKGIAGANAKDFIPQSTAMVGILRFYLFIPARPPACSPGGSLGEQQFTDKASIPRSAARRDRLAQWLKTQSATDYVASGASLIRGKLTALALELGVSKASISDADRRGEIVKVALAAQTVLDIIGRF
jgi:hypothetical protein